MSLGLCPTKLPVTWEARLITLVYLQRSLMHLLIASEDGERLSRNPLQILLLCVGKTAIMYAKTVQREDCTSVCVCVWVVLLLRRRLSSHALQHKLGLCTSAFWLNEQQLWLHRRRLFSCDFAGLS